MADLTADEALQILAEKVADVAAGVWIVENPTSPTPGNRWRAEVEIAGMTGTVVAYSATAEWAVSEVVRHVREIAPKAA